MSGMPTSTVAGTRSSRALASTARLLEPAAGADSTIFTSQTSGANTVGSHATAMAGSVSNLSVFLTNLRLLDLDLLPDWPGITPSTFVGKDAGQKKRVQSVEWALYQLFMIWDPDETRHVSFPDCSGMLLALPRRPADDAHRCLEAPAFVPADRPSFFPYTTGCSHTPARFGQKIGSAGSGIRHCRPKNDAR